MPGRTQFPFHVKFDDWKFSSTPLPLTPDYVTGLCDGEGSFTYGRTPLSIRPRFSLVLCAWDKDLVFAIRKFFGVGGVYHRPPREKHIAGWSFTVSSRADLSVIIQHFDRYPLRGTKRDNYRVWKRIFELAGNPRSNWAELHDLAATLSDMTTKGRKSTKLQVNYHG